MRSNGMTRIAMIVLSLALVLVLVMCIVGTTWIVRFVHMICLVIC